MLQLEIADIQGRNSRFLGMQNQNSFYLMAEFSIWETFRKIDMVSEPSLTDLIFIALHVWFLTKQNEETLLQNTNRVRVSCF